jgi:hypothetical protein
MIQTNRTPCHIIRLRRTPVSRKADPALFSPHPHATMDAAGRAGVCFTTVCHYAGSSRFLSRLRTVAIA